MGISGNGHEAVVGLLLEAGADAYGGANTSLSIYMNPLWKVAQNGHEAVVRMLLNKGADVNAGASDGNMVQHRVKLQYSVQDSSRSWWLLMLFTLLVRGRL